MEHPAGDHPVMAHRSAEQSETLWLSSSTGVFSRNQKPPPSWTLILFSAELRAAAGINLSSYFLKQKQGNLKLCLNGNKISQYTNMRCDFFMFRGKEIDLFIIIREFNVSFYVSF